MLRVVEEMVEAIEHVKNVLTPALYAFAVLAMAAETFFFARTHKSRDKRSRWLGVKCGALSFGVGGVFSALVTVSAQLWMYEHRVVDVGAVFGVGAFGWPVWVACFVAQDVMFYVSHRLEHRVRALWAVHVVHHSSRHFDLTAGVRGSVLDALTHLPFTVWIPLFGVHPLIVVLLETAFRFYGLAYHTELVDKLGFLEGILVTPSSHRVHHGKDVDYLDCNYGGFFCVWDRLLGTYVPETHKPTYGLVKDWHGYDVVDAQLHEFRALAKDITRAPTLRHKLAHALMPPSWSPPSSSPSSPSSSLLGTKRRDRVEASSA
jgi:sterol desaturase/sphingolipid hydroxylase (fatty acid hydroxylase superfamily)